ncbi:hypothetical protein QBC39DRAFT_344204 [Podospora conica]|nr:hypothetical protein QBC39DRAFT_344204 [Schizothecium conicum]
MLFNIKISVLVATALAPFLSSAAVVRLYHDRECSDDQFIQEVNVWDDTCCDWPEPGWASYKVVTPGGRLQALTMYPHNVCVYPGIYQSCVDFLHSTHVGECVPSWQGSPDGLAHSMGSTWFGYCTFTPPKA